jgi:transposase
MTIKGFHAETGEVVEIDRVSNDRQSLVEAFCGLEAPLYGAMESGTNSWAVYRILKPYFEQLIVVDPASVWGKEGRRGAKTDRRDATKLALKMYRGELEPLYIPDEKTQDQRSLGRAKINATRRITKLVNEMGSLLRSWGIIVECSLLSKKGEALIEDAKSKLPKHSLKVLELLLKELELAQAVERELEKDVEAEAAEEEDCQRLMSIPDVGPLTALVVKAEVGDINRFGCSDQLISYCGLSPNVFQTSERTYYGKLNRACNRYLKYVLVLRAQGMSRSKKENPMRQTYWRVILKGKNHAKIAVARQLARVIWRMLKDKQLWNASEIDRRRKLSAEAA